MCGIFALLNNTIDKISDISLNFNKGKSRGPENSTLIEIKELNSFIGFHRLAINGYNNTESEQPFYFDNFYLICNGEIYNHKELFDILKITPRSKSDCEVIIHMYRRFGMEQTLQMLDGVFAFILIDLNINYIYIARDTYGVRPLYSNTYRTISSNEEFTTYAFASEMKCIDDFGNFTSNVKQFEPGCCSIFQIDKEYQSQKITYISTFTFSSPNSFSTTLNINKLLKIEEYVNVLKNIYSALEDAVIKRVKNTEREIACLLSGGLDSSIICGLVKKHHKGDLHTWSIGLEGSEDLKYAQIVADHIGSIHHSIVVTEKEFLDNIPEVIKAIESYDTTTIRASVGNWTICKYIKEQSSAKVIFNGDGSDEVMGGYLYFHAAPDCIAFDKECRKLLSDIHYFDVLRSDKSISSHGLEARTPFLDRKFVQTFLSIDPNIRYHKGFDKPEKYLIREAIDLYEPNLLPKEVLWRTKEAFSDGVSKQTKSWFEIIQDHVKNNIYMHFNNINENEVITKFNSYKYLSPTTLEQLYYRDTFNKQFKSLNVEKIIPYFWMPNFVNATDASARTLDIYKDKQQNNE